MTNINEVSSASDTAPVHTNVNSDPIYWGRYELLSDQDATTLKHHIVDQLVMSAGILAIIEAVNHTTWPRLLIVVCMASLLISIHTSTVMATNLLIGVVQLHPAIHPRVWMPLWIAKCRHGFVLFIGWCLAIHVHVKRFVHRASGSVLRGLALTALTGPYAASIDPDDWQATFDWAMTHAHDEVRARYPQASKDQGE